MRWRADDFRIRETLGRSKRRMPVIGIAGWLIVTALAPASAAVGEVVGGLGPGVLDNSRSGEADTCLSCHDNANVAGHPVDFVPDRSLPSAYPLANDGTFTCTTCHLGFGFNAPHAQTAAPDPDLCAACHPSEFFTAMPDRGTSIRGRGHLAVATGDWVSIDPYSQACLACHAEKAPATNAKGFSLVALPGLGNHSIGGRYQDAAAYGGYRPLSLLVADILLPQGRVSCVSCHMPYSQEHGRRPHTRRRPLQRMSPPLDDAALKPRVKAYPSGRRLLNAAPWWRLETSHISRVLDFCHPKRLTK